MGIKDVQKWWAKVIGKNDGHKWWAKMIGKIDEQKTRGRNDGQEWLFSTYNLKKDKMISTIYEVIKT